MKTHTRPTARLTLVVILTAVMLALTTTPAGAHTAPVPVEIIPSPGSELAAVPDEMILRFDGDFTDEIDVGLVDSTGTIVPSVLSVDRRTVRVLVDDPSTLPDDTYRIYWQARTTHGSDAPDGIGAESRQVHFFVGGNSSGRIVEKSADGTSPSTAGLGFGALAAALMITGGSCFVARQRMRRLMLPLAIGCVCAVGGVLLMTDSSSDSAQLWSTRTDDGTSLVLASDSEWNLQIDDANGLATPWATGAQLRFTDPTSGDSDLVDLQVDMDSLGRWHAPSPTGTEGWEVELVVSTFTGPVHNFSLSGA